MVLVDVEVEEAVLLVEVIAAELMTVGYIEEALDTNGGGVLAAVVFVGAGGNVTSDTRTCGLFWLVW